MRTLPAPPAALPSGVYFPLAHHFEQSIHVHHRLQNYRAWRCMDYASETHETIAQAIVDELRGEAAPRQSRRTVLDARRHSLQKPCEEANPTTVVELPTEHRRTFIEGGIGPAELVFTLPGLPTAAGIVWTDGDANHITFFEAFGPGMVSLGVLGPFDLGDAFNTGETAEDRFFGVRDAAAQQGAAADGRQVVPLEVW